MKPQICDKAPKGWHCTRERGHDGPCALKRNRWGAFWDTLGEALGEYMWGGNR